MMANLLYRISGGYGRDAFRVLDPCCGTGDAVAQLADDLRERSSVTVETYGVELHRERAEEARERLDHTLGVDLFQTSIGNSAFGLLFLNPPYDWDRETRRLEHRFLNYCTRYLAPDGVLVFIVPRERLAVSAKYLASHYRRVMCWAFPEPERQDYDQVVLLGLRKSQPHHLQHVEDEIKQWAYGEPEPLDEYARPIFDPPATEAGDVLFTTRSVDPGAAAAEARRSGLWTSPQVMDTLWPAQSPKTRPLMPLRRGHMAMLTAAGFLDNLRLEADGRQILVKGRAVKKMEEVETTETTEVYRERLHTTVVCLDLINGEITDVAA